MSRTINISSGGQSTAVLLLSGQVPIKSPSKNIYVVLTDE